MQEMLTASKTDPSKICSIGDTADDIFAGKKADVVTIGFTGGLHSEERIRAANPDHVVHSLYEVLDILNG